MQLRFSNKRQTCPFCGARRGWAPIAKLGERMTSSRHYGYCHSCGESSLPDRATLEQVMASLGDQYGLYFEEEYLEDSVTIPWDALPDGPHYLSIYLKSIWGSIASSHLAPLIRGDAKGNTIFVHTNQDGEVTGTKTMWYDPETGKRVKPGIPIALDGGLVDFPAVYGYFTGGPQDDDTSPRLWNWTTKARGFRPGLWGLSTVPEDAPIYLVESEKSALIASLHWPEKHFVATGGATSLTAQKLRDLKGHKVTIVMDNDDAGVRGASRIGKMCEIYEVNHYYIDTAALAKSHKVKVTDGLDIGDIVLELVKREVLHA